MPARLRNLYADAGATWRERLLLPAVLVAPDLTGYHALVHVRRAADLYAPVMLALDSAAEGDELSLDVASRVVTFAVPGPVLAAVPPGSWVWDLVVVSADGNDRARVFEGLLQIRASVSA